MGHLLSSKRFWLACAGVLTIVLRDSFGLAITDEQMQQIAIVIASWVVGDSLRAANPDKENNQ